jgi:ubiquinone/menaquinone biosynthesis C-methylase UbiE
MNRPERRQPASATTRHGAVSRPRTADFAGVDASDHIGELSSYLERATTTLAAAKRQSLAALDLQPGERALDVGCGTGEDVALLGDHVGPHGQAVGLDASRRLIRHARRCHGHRPSVRFVAGDAHHLPFEAGAFTVARVERVLMHVADPARVIAEMARVVAPGGRIAAFEPDWDTLVIDADPLAHTRAITRRWSDHVRHGTIGRRLARLLADAGLSAIDVTPVPTVMRDLPLAETLLELDATAAATLEPHDTTPGSTACASAPPASASSPP